MGKWGWGTIGDWKLDDRNHRLQDERGWVKRRHAEWRAGCQIRVYLHSRDLTLLGSLPPTWSYSKAARSSLII